MRNFFGERGVCEVFDLGQRQRLRCKRERQDRRIRRIYFAVDRRVRESLREKVGSAIDSCLDLLLGDVDIQVQIKLESDHRAPEGTRGSHLVQSRSLAELALKRRGDRGGHDFRAGTRIKRLYLNVWVIYLRQSRDSN